MWELDPRFHTPGWDERRLKELREEQEKANMMHLCLPLPDGKLDEYQNGYNECKVSRIDNVSVLVMEKTGNHLTYVPGILIDGVGDMMSLTAKQAISLLSWLEQNRPELAALAEQEQA